MLFCFLSSPDLREANARELATELHQLELTANTTAAGDDDDGGDGFDFTPDAVSDPLPVFCYQQALWVGHVCNSN